MNLENSPGTRNLVHYIHQYLIPTTRNLDQPIETHLTIRLVRRLTARGLVCGIVLLAGQLCNAYASQEQTPSPPVFDQREQTFVAGLLQRRLFDVAEAHCLELLDRKEIQVADQTALTVQLIQTRTSMALVADAASTEDVWPAVWQTGEDFEKQFARHPGKMQVSIQTGLAYLQRAQRMGCLLYTSDAADE